MQTCMSVLFEGLFLLYAGCAASLKAYSVVSGLEIWNRVIFPDKAEKIHGIVGQSPELVFTVSICDTNP